MQGKQLFTSATLRLTLWYMLILTIMSIFFSIIVYSIASFELHRPLGPRRGNITIQDDTTTSQTLEDLHAAREAEGIKRLTNNLVIFNTLTIAAGGFASYFLAKRTLRPIETALEAQSRFTTDAAHELRTPLAVMQSEIEIGLRDKKSSLANQKSLLQSSLDEVNRLRSLTDRLLLLSSGDPTIATSSTRLDEVVTEAVNRVIPLAQAKSIRINTDLGKEVVQADIEVLTDTVVILLDNAIKYSPAKSQVEISALEQGKNILLQVKDNGSGIVAKDLPHIFNRFYRADQSRSKQTVEGHGLGLSIAKRNIELMRGSLTASSELGKGTTFSVRLQR